MDFTNAKISTGEEQRKETVKEAKMTEEETNALNDLYARALDPEWQRAHRAMGFASPIADLYDALEELAKERSEEDGTDRP